MAWCFSTPRTNKGGTRKDATLIVRVTPACSRRGPADADGRRRAGDHRNCWRGWADGCRARGCRDDVLRGDRRLMRDRHCGFDVVHLLSGTATLRSDWILAKLLGLSAVFPMLNAKAYQANAPLHTVMVEIWLYAVYPVAMLLICRFKDQAVAIAFTVIWLIGLAWCAVNPKYIIWWHNGSLLGFLAYWWIGAWLVGAGPAIIRRLMLLAIGFWVASSVLLMAQMTNALFVTEARKICFAIMVGIFITYLDRGEKRVPHMAGQLGMAGYSI